jgi:CelD/BcsL family acetyltransferase involved in cellulose biosynthesis
LNRLSDYDLLVEMNLNRFGETSYFYDSRFTESFRDVMHFLHQHGWLRMISLQLGPETAAIDLSALFNSSYVVMLGGTHLQFPGIAKAMNMQHIEFACQNQVSKVDFLCGDFCWKKLWHLDPEPLHKYVSPGLKREHEEMTDEIRKQLDATDPAREIGVLGL